jgi:endogenous inhibitor of DNA gyrase (YacG/DUF329 family)
MPRCPVCQREFSPEDSRAMPFCGERCKLIDLGRWLDERYGLPIEREEDEQSSAPNPEDRLA